ncbi:hypothetical protein ACFQZ2_11055 [Streptomonospora algeriensis]|uniref:Antitoxin FitA-like ribbon-helix-helix domain-containing protein n=1 Tax=Streptomonospora algeriensis TaxID=995084 RepID=A0ABW3BH43_9ACTN
MGGSGGTAAITVRSLPDSARRALKRRAARNDGSVEAEARAIPEDAAGTERSFIEDRLEAAADLRGEPLSLPERSAPREVDLT